MTTINDQPQHLLARYADRTGAKWQYQLSKHWNTGPHWQHAARDTVKLRTKIRLVLSEYGLPSHLKPYKDNPRLPGDGYRVPTGEDSCNQPHEFWSASRNEWLHQQAIGGVFDGKSADYRLPASVLPPDWDEMTREDAPAVASQHPEIFEAHGMEWYRHDGSDQSPCDPEMRAQVLFRDGDMSGPGKLKDLGWKWYGRNGDIIGWRPADAPAKLPRPGQQPRVYNSVPDMMVGEGVSQSVQDMVRGLEAQDEVQALKARVHELEGELVKKLHPTQRHLSNVEDSLQYQREKTDEHRAGRIKMHRRAQRAESKLTKTLKDAKKWKACAEWWRDSVHNIAKKAIAEEQEKPAAASTPTLRPISEMPADVPDGCVRVFGGYYENQGEWIISSWSRPQDTHFLDIRLPAPPDTDEELRREFEVWMKGHYQIPKSTLTFIKENGVYALREHETAFQAYKAGNAAR
jgi:hypothetical protein